MTVKEVFELRKQGKIEEAYEAIRPMYAVHKGKYTTLCMFWTASDILKKRLKELKELHAQGGAGADPAEVRQRAVERQKRLDEAEKIFKALLKVLPNVDNRDGKALSSILHAAVALDKEDRTFSMLSFVEQLKVEQLSDEDWKTIIAPAVAGQPSHPIPSVAQQVLTCAFHELQEQMYGDFVTRRAPLSHDEVLSSCLQVMPLLQEAMRRNPRDKHNRRYMAVVYTVMGEREKAVAIYRELLMRCHDSYLYAELAELTDEPGPKAALYCKAIQNQRQEKFRTGYRLALARLLIDRDKPRAAYELKKCVDTRKALGYHITRDVEQMQQLLTGIQPVGDAEQQDFYKRMSEKFPH